MFALIIDHVYVQVHQGSYLNSTSTIPPFPIWHFLLAVTSPFHSHSLSLHLLDELRTGEGKEAEIKAEN